MAFGAHMGDHPVYPDCRPEFVQTYASMAASCYRGEAVYCGTCGTCVERCEAFAFVGVPDPTRYAHQLPVP